MDEQSSLQVKMEALAQRYLQRTINDVVRIRELIETAIGGDASSLDEAHHLAHRIHGGGAMFGFELVGELASKLEALVEAHKGGKSAVAPPQYEELIGGLEAELHKAAQAKENP